MNKRRILHVTLIVLLIALLAFSACEKQTQEEPQANQEEQVAFNDDIELPSEPQPPTGMGEQGLIEVEVINETTTPVNETENQTTPTPSGTDDYDIGPSTPNPKEPEIDNDSLDWIDNMEEIYEQNEAE